MSLFFKGCYKEMRELLTPSYNLTNNGITECAHVCNIIGRFYIGLKVMQVYNNTILSNYETILPRCLELKCPEETSFRHVRPIRGGDLGHFI